MDLGVCKAAGENVGLVGVVDGVKYQLFLHAESVFQIASQEGAGRTMVGCPLSCSEQRQA